MARKSKGSEPPGPPEVTPQQGIDLLHRQVAQGERLLARRPIPKDDYSSWELVTRNLLEKAFGKNSPNVTSITSVGKYGAFPMGAGDEWWDNHRAESLQTQMTKLRGLIELLRTEAELRDEGVVKPEQSLTGHRIFLVHGHDGTPIGIEITAPTKLSAAALNRVLRRLGFPPVTRADLAPLRAA